MIQYRKAFGPQYLKNKNLFPHDVYHYTNSTLNKLSMFNGCVSFLLEVEIEKGGMNTLSDFDRIDGMAIRNSYIIKRKHLNHIGQIQRINAKIANDAALFKCDII